ncbi:MAG: hypothetical protein KGN37_05980 [Burkholderiales bacterium]|nr:hypothetical protein [Burkholderiales bacterium]
MLIHSSSILVYLGAITKKGIERLTPDDRPNQGAISERVHLYMEGFESIENVRPTEIDLVFFTAFSGGLLNLPPKSAGHTQYKPCRPCLTMMGQP